MNSHIFIHMSIQALPQDFAALAMVVVLLGIRHGLDADHLAAIDGLTRANSLHRPRLSRMAGALFSAGHGLVVIAVALSANAMASAWTVPAWLESTGSWTSIVVLTLLALINLHSLHQTPRHEVVKPKGLRSAIFSKLLAAQRPRSIAAVGALFAVSVDTISQATLFGVTAGQFGGWQAALALALLFMVGMLLIDGIHGLWVARLIRQADAKARLTSRLMTWAVSAISLLTAAFGISFQIRPDWGGLLEDDMWWLSLALMLTVLLSYLASKHVSARRLECERSTRSLAVSSD
jgi:high-affinity nickel-transport protein